MNRVEYAKHTRDFEFLKNDEHFYNRLVYEDNAKMFE